MKEDNDELEDDVITKQKIIIQGDDYQLKQVEDSSELWDLYLLRKKKNGKEEFKIDKYGTSLHRAMMAINNYRIAKKLNGKALTMKQYLILYKKLIKRLVEELHGL